MNLSIAICDDDARQAAKASAMLRTYLHSRPMLQGEVTTFSDGQSLLAAAEARHGFDLYLLDIVMPGLNGIEIGRRLRELARRGHQGRIIFLTCANDYAADSYSVQAFFLPAQAGGGAATV